MKVKKMPVSVRMMGLLLFGILVSCQTKDSNIRNLSGTNGTLSAVFSDFISADEKIALSWTTDLTPDRWVIQKTTDSGSPQRSTVIGTQLSFTDTKVAAGHSYSYTILAEFDTAGGASPEDRSFQAITIAIPPEATLIQWGNQSTYSGVVEQGASGQPQVRIDWTYPAITGMARWDIERQGNAAFDKSSRIIVGAATPVQGSHAVVDTSPASTGNYLYNFVLVNDWTSPEGNPIQTRITAQYLMVDIQNKTVSRGE